jgi:hypothetical protein
MAVLVFESVTGLAVTLAPFSATIEWTVLVHTVIGAVALSPIAWYFALHWKDYRSQAASDVLLVGYVGLVALFICCVSGLVVTWQGLFATSTSRFWRNTHLISTVATISATAAHLVLSWLRRRGTELAAGAARWAAVTFVRVGAAGGASGPCLAVFGYCVQQHVSGGLQPDLR